MGLLERLIGRLGKPVDQNFQLFPELIYSATNIYTGSSSQALLVSAQYISKKSILTMILDAKTTSNISVLRLYKAVLNLLSMSLGRLKMNHLP